MYLIIFCNLIEKKYNRKKFFKTVELSAFVAIAGTAILDISMEISIFVDLSSTQNATGLKPFDLFV